MVKLWPNCALSLSGTATVCALAVECEAPVGCLSVMGIVSASLTAMWLKGLFGRSCVWEIGSETGSA